MTRGGIIGLVITGWLALAFQAGAAHMLAVGGAKPDFLLVLVVLAAVVFDWRVGLVYGIFLGLLQDLWIGQYIGLHVLSKGATGFVVGYVTQGIYDESLPVPVLFTFIATVASETLLVLLLEFMGAGRYFVPANLPVGLRAAVYNALITLLLFRKALAFRRAFGREHWEVPW